MRNCNHYLLWFSKPVQLTLLYVVLNFKCYQRARFGVYFVTNVYYRLMIFCNVINTFCGDGIDDVKWLYVPSILSIYVFFCSRSISLVFCSNKVNSVVPLQNVVIRWGVTAPYI